MLKNPSWKTLSSKKIYENDWITLQHDEFQTPSGKKGIYGLVSGKDFALVIPKIGDDYYLVETYRYTVNKMSLEFPAGGIDPTEEPLESAQRELSEEVGLESNNFKKLGFLYSSNGFSTIGCHVFLAENCSFVPQKLEDSEEGMQAKQFSIHEIEKLIKTGKITDGPTVSAFCLYLLNR